MGDNIKTDSNITKSVNERQAISNREYFISLEKIRKFKEKVMKLDAEENNRNTGHTLSPSINKIKIKPRIKRKLKPIELLSKEYQTNIKTEAEHMDKIIKKEEASPKKIPPITDSLYKRLLQSKNFCSSKDLSRSDILDDFMSQKNPKTHSRSPMITNRLYNRPDKVVQSNRNVNRSLSPIKPRLQYKNNYIILPGNNKELIVKCMKKRNDNWEEIDKDNYSYASFIWTPLSYEIDYTLAAKVNQIVNHFEYHSEISNKMRLFANLLRYCDLQKKIDLFSFFPLTIVIPLNDHENIFNEQLASFEKFYNSIGDYISPKDNIKYNDFFKLVIYSKKIGSNHQLKIPQSSYAGKNIWLIKPINMNRGRCIKIESDLNKIITMIKELKMRKEIKNEKNEKVIEADYVILQKYIERPLLYQGRKFDIRLWVLIISEYPNNVFIFKEGHLKATCEQYSLNTNDPYIHLTNYSVQKHHKDFSKVEKGNEISFNQFKQELKDISLFNKIYNRICYIVRLTISSAKQRINLLNRKKCFEIFGYDFLIDENLNPFLIEVNTNPGLEESSPLIAMLTPRMIDDALKLTIDEEYKRTNQDEPFHVDGYNDNENMWEKFSLI